ncbi:DUF397 domain-containing protein [Amycolatopsis saalfeldensis]
MVESSRSNGQGDDCVEVRFREDRVDVRLQSSRTSR